MTKLILFGAIAFCLVARCALGQYQTAPAYGNGYQQQRKMAPQPQGYQQQLQASMNSNGAYGNKANNMPQADQEQQAAGADMSDSGYGKQQASGATRMGPIMMKQSQGAGYGQQQQQSSYGNQGANGGAYGMKQGAKYEEPEHPPMPFAWGYDINDGYGATQYHKENGDEYGKRTGSYGYMDAYGVYRNVYYVADENGFRATIKTNEPGTANEAPADVDWTAEEPPANVFMGNKDNSGYSSSASSSYNSNTNNMANSGEQYGSSNGNGQQQQYGAAMTPGTNGAIGHQYSASPMKTGSSGYGSGASQSAQGKQYGGSMMAGGKQYGASQQQSMNNNGQQYGGMMQSMMNGVGRQSAKPARAYGQKMIAATNAASSRSSSSAYSSANAANDANDEQQQYSGEAPGASQLPEFAQMMMGIASKVQQQQQQYGQSGLEEQQQQYGANNNEGANNMMQQQYGSPAASSMVMNGGGNSQAQALNSKYSAAMDGTSTYSSMRMQANAGANAAGSSGYSGNGAGASQMMAAYGGMQRGAMASAAGQYGNKSAAKMMAATAGNGQNKRY